MVGLNPVVEFQLHGVANFVFNQDLNRLLVRGGFVRIVRRPNLLPFRMRSVNEVRALPLRVGLLNVVRVSFVVRLHLIGQAVRNVDCREVDGDEERAVVVGRVASRALDVPVSRNSDIKGAVFGGVIGVLEPHGTDKMQLVTSGHPRTGFDVH